MTLNQGHFLEVGREQKKNIFVAFITYNISSF